MKGVKNCSAKEKRLFLHSICVQHFYFIYEEEEENSISHWWDLPSDSGLAHIILNFIYRGAVQYLKFRGFGQLFTISVEQCNSLPGTSVLTVALENFTIKKSFTAIHQNASLKRQCQEICCRFFAEKIWPGPHMNSQKQFRKLFRFHENILSQKLENRVSMTLCPRSQQLQWHCVREVNNNATLYSHSQWLRCKLNNYFSTCLRSQLLHGHAIFESIKLHFL